MWEGVGGDARACKMNENQHFTNPSMICVHKHVAASHDRSFSRSNMSGTRTAPSPSGTSRGGRSPVSRRRCSTRMGLRYSRAAALAAPSSLSGNGDSFATRLRPAVRPFCTTALREQQRGCYSTASRSTLTGSALTQNRPWRRHRPSASYRLPIERGDRQHPPRAQECLPT